MRFAALLLAALVVTSCDSGYETPEISYIRGVFFDSWRVETVGTRMSKTYRLTLRLVEREGTIEQYPGDAGELSIVRGDQSGTQGYREIYRIRTNVETIAGTYDVAENRVEFTVRGEGRNGDYPFTGTFTGRLGVASDRIEGTLRGEITGMPDGRHTIDEDLILEAQY